MDNVPWKDQADSCLDFPRSHCGLLVVAGQGGRLGGDLLEDVVDERVQDGHGLGADAGVRVHLLQHLHEREGTASMPVDLSGQRLDMKQMCSSKARKCTTQQ